MSPGPYDELEKQAENLEKQSKEEFTQKSYSSAIVLLEKAQEIYSQLGYQGKMGMINKRIAQLKNLVKFEKQDSLVKTKSEVEFQQRVNQVLQEKQNHLDKKVAEQKALPPEMRRNLEKITHLLEKAEKEEKQNNYKRVIGRYKYILELYHLIPNDLIDFTAEVSEIEKKLAELKNKSQVE
ncbi:MAG: hypothetical protein ACW990_05075 [Promethearchaeota archaeon]|jgi:hypothetical protein